MNKTRINQETNRKVLRDYTRVCERCDNCFKTTGKYSKVCPACDRRWKTGRFLHLNKQEDTT